MKIAFVGNANNYPLAVARAMRSQGHQVDFFLVNDPSYTLDNPENRYDEYAAGYPDWIIDLRPLDMWSYAASLGAENITAFNSLISRLQQYDALVFNQVAVFLAKYVTKPVYLLLTGTDVLTFADPNYSSYRLSLYQNIEDIAERERIKLFYEQRVADQRNTIHTCAGFNFFPIGVVPDGDALIKSIGTTPEKRDSYMVLDTDSIEYAPFKENDIFTITFAARLTWIRDDASIATRLDLKGTDIFFKALSLLASRGRTVRVHLFRKGAHVEQSKELAEQLGVGDWIIWHDEVTQAELLESFKAMDVVIDNLESPAIGMVALDAMATGRPVIARVADMSGFGVIEPPPICSARSPEEVADWIERLMDDKALKEDYARRGRRFVDTYFAANLAANRILDVVQGLNNPFHLQRLEYLHKCPSATKWMYRGLRLYHVIRNRQFSMLLQHMFPKYVRTPIEPTLSFEPDSIPYRTPVVSEVCALLPTTPEFTKVNGDTLKITHYIGTLGPGGAERQLSYVATGLKKMGHDVTVHAVWLESEQDSHYAQLLRDAGVKVEPTGTDTNIVTTEQYEDWVVNNEIVAYIPECIRQLVFTLANKLIKNKPDILHCWLDVTNCSGAWAGLLVGIPKIICSFRSVNPTHFDNTCYPGMSGWMHDNYLFFKQHKSISFVANSHVGAEDYLDWLNINGSEHLDVIHNGLDFGQITRSGQRDIDELRANIGIPANTPIIAGIFRLTEEKRPFDFLHVVARVRETIPNLHIVHAGVGALSDDFVEEARRLGINACLKMLGQRDDVPCIMAMSDVLLLCSRVEGFSNVVLEASWLGVPPVATRVGEMEYIVKDRSSGFLHDVGDIEGMAESIKQLLTNHELRQSAAKIGHQHILDNFSCDSMLESTINFYLKGK